MRHAEALAPGFTVVIQINSNDLSGTCQSQTLQHVEANTPETKHNCG